MKGYYINLEKRTDRNDYMKKHVLSRPFSKTLNDSTQLNTKKEPLDIHYHILSV